MSKNNLLVSLENAGIYKSPKWLIRGVSLEVKSGQIVTLIGPNGSGKTTTAKMVLNILEPDEGSLKRYTNKIAYVPQKINIDWTMPLRVVDFMRLTNNLSNNEIIVIKDKKKVLAKFNNVEEIIAGTIKNTTKGFVAPPVK